jgi:hypothetical protein
MKRSAIVVCVALVVLLALNAPGVAGVGWLSVYPNQSGTCGSLVDNTAGLLTFYVVHTSDFGINPPPAEATASRFKLVYDDGTFLGGTFLSETTGSLASFGASDTGITVCYGSCLQSPITVLTVNFFVVGLTPPCSFIQVVGHPDAASGVVEVVDCSDAIHAVGNGVAIVNEDASCPACTVDPGIAAAEETVSGTFPLCETIATEPSTWGKIKALYQAQ